MLTFNHGIKSLISSHSIKLLFRIVVTISIFAMILRSIDVDQVWKTLRQARLDLLLAALPLQFGSTTLSAYRWQLIMHNLNFGQSISFYWRSYFKASFFNQGLPTSIGGDALKVLDVAGQGFRKRDALYGVMLDRVTGLAALMWLNLVAYLFDPDLLPDPIYHLTLLLVVGSLVGFVAVSYLKHLPWLDAYPQLQVIRAISERLHQAFLNNRILLIGSSLLIPALAMLSVCMIGLALGLRYGLVTYFVIVPPAILLTIIPVSLAGWGIREGTLVALFSLIGADKAVILAMSILYGLMQIIVSLPGFIIYLSSRKHLL
ncbi:MAG: lysylphosphatidylglycerol synthase transmembrane domain-containing protein [Candidatus Contendobacter sp.]|nr:lysylphosphatidylglycerol synthase transmembrane domain-containing protein [Candidatus Contendobacter sp.]MDS4059916.1 lysylphosphatidylglycerol synthase transmembrane domain-containing protein [Candidatus Contendobacter sp.]